MTEAEHEHRKGLLAGLGAYVSWGVFPLYFALLRPAGAWEILSHRILWTAALCALLLVLTRDLRWVVDLARTPARLASVALAGAVIAVNWGVYTLAVLTGHVTEAALGYFLNPLVTVALGVVLLGERLRRLQWVAVAIGAVAAVYLTVSTGSPPWISFALALSFATYSLLKKRLGVTLSPLQSLAGESILLAPVAAVVLARLAAHGQTTWTGHGADHTLLLVSTGVVTAVPLMLFATAATRIPLSTIGLLQFVGPVLQLLCAFAMGESIPPARWLGFALVWVALVLLSIDMVRHVSRGRRDRPDDGPPVAEPV